MIETRYIEFETHISEVVDITDEVQKSLESTSLKAGMVLIFVSGATGAVTTIEYEDGLLDDLDGALEKLSPRKSNMLITCAGRTAMATHIRLPLGPSL